jgi:hypothetical protein
MRFLNPTGLRPPSKPKSSSSSWHLSTGIDDIGSDAAGTLGIPLRDNGAIAGTPAK